MTTTNNNKSEKFYITTPIYYANGTPHIGHFLTTTIADVFARLNRKRLGKENVYFTTGLDCHGTTVEQAALKAGYTIETIQEFIEIKEKQWVQAFKDTNISYDYFVNTTNEKHKKYAQEFIQKMIDKGDVYKASYQGKYCNGCEKFLTLSDLNDEGICPLHRPDQVVDIEEENYFFKLSKFAPKVKELIETNEIIIEPKNKRNEMLTRLEAGIEDISISRPKEKVSWGIDFPGDNEQTVYVWVEALMNYKSSLFINDREEFWNYTVHTLAKDINWFHNVIWPAFLLSAEYPLYKQSYVHGFLTVGGQKISKSLGNIITPNDLIERYGVDGARYLILANFPFKDDSDITWDALDNKYNGELANGLGNTFARLTKLAEKSGFEFELDILDPSIWEGEEFEELSNFRVDFVLQNVWKKITILDKHINENEPWAIKDGAKLKEVLTTELNMLKAIAYISEPFIPETAKTMQKVLDQKNIVAGQILFPRI